MTFKMGFIGIQYCINTTHTVHFVWDSTCSTAKEIGSVHEFLMRTRFQVREHVLTANHCQPLKDQPLEEGVMKSVELVKDQI